MRTTFRIAMCLGLAFSAGTLLADEADPLVAPKAKKVEIGLPASLFQGVPTAFHNALSLPFRQMMKEQTGMDGNVQAQPDAMTMADKLQDGKLQIAIFQGHEFAWAKAKYKELTPLVVILPNQPPTQAFILVRWNCAALDFAGMKNKILTLPPGVKDHTKLFLEQQKKETKLKDGDFKAVLRSDSVVNAIFDVIDQKATFTCVDSVGLEYFQSNYPGQFKNLKVLAKSPIFPQACIAVRQGQMEEATVKKFQDTLLRATELGEGKTMMTLWKLQKFEKVPASYEQHLKDCNKTFPFQGVVVEKADK